MLGEELGIESYDRGAIEVLRQATQSGGVVDEPRLTHMALRRSPFHGTACPAGRKFFGTLLRIILPSP